MSTKEWRGSFAIPMTPYDDKDRIDEDVLRADGVKPRRPAGGMVLGVGLRERLPGAVRPLRQVVGVVGDAVVAARRGQVDRVEADGQTTPLTVAGRDRVGDLLAIHTDPQ